MSNSDNKFSWVQTHKELVEYISGKKDSQKELIELLKNAGATIFNDRDEEGSTIDLEEIDPFTFFCYINKYGPAKRLKILQNVAKETGVEVPNDEKGLPSANAQKVWLFPYKKDRTNNEIQRLWRFFKSTLDEGITNDKFQDILNIQNVAETKLTEALFYVKPEQYLPINGPTIPYLSEVLNVNPSFITWEEYLDILEQVRAKTDKAFYEISYEAWLWGKKSSVVQDIIDRYKQFLEDEGIEDERYKWEAILHFQQTFDLDADNFNESLKDAISKAVNLVYQNSIGFIRKAVEYYPEEVREMFRGLYNESKPLKNRYEDFVEASEDILPKVIERHGKKLNHQQDERTISYYLTMRFPEKYPLYKNETYQYLISILDDEEGKPAGEKFFHYLELSEALISVIESNGDVIDMVEAQLTQECYQGEQKWMVFQDVLWINMRTISITSYWLFQGNPNVFDLTKALKEEKLSSWKVNAHKSKIIPGDKIILWASGNKRGVYALAEIESDVYEDEVNEVEVPYYFEKPDDDAFDQVQIRITYNLANDPISYDQIKKVEELKDLKIGNQGTNFSATKEEYEALINIIREENDSKWDELVKVVSKINDEQAVRKFFATVEHVLNEFELNPDDEITYASSIKKYLQFTIGSRYVTHLERKKGKTVQGFYVDNAHLENLKGKQPDLKVSDKALPPEEGEMTWVYMDAEGVIIEDFLDGIVALAKKGVEGQSKSQYRAIHPGVHNPWIAKVALDDGLLDKLLRGDKMVNKQKQPELNHPLNTIFYGPPGTGKTYSTIKRAAEIVTGREIEDYDEAKRIFNDGLGETIEFITFHQNYSYEDFIQGLRPDLQGGDQLSFKRVDGVFKRIADKALINYKESKKAPVELNKKKAFEEALDTLKEKVIESTDQVRINETAYFIGVEEDAFRYSADNWTLDGKGFNGFRMKFTDLIDFFENNITERREIKDLQNVSGLAKQHATYFFNTYKLIKDLVEENNTQEASTDKKNYVIIIDEINRANISRVFGELITLIEPDKRYGRELHIPAKLPSGESFSVPENLHIIGTMNTADKSIALLDIALRRRFEFEAMYPKYQIDGEVIHDKDILKKINERIMKLKGHDFQIGHSYFMKNDATLKQRMNRKVIPLLLEYFMNDEKEVKSILEYADLQIEENRWPLRITGKK